MVDFRSSHLQAGALALAVAVAMLLPGDALPPQPTFHFADKAVHALMFFLLTISWSRSFRATGRWRRPVLSATLASLAYGLLLEGLQGWVPGRYLDPWDLVANSLGVAVGCCLQSVADRG